MKKFAVLILIMVLFMSCSQTRRVSPNINDLPSGFSLVREAGNGWYLYSSPVGYFLVTIQVQGKMEIGFSNRFIDMVFIGKELAD